ncbi:MAG: polymer-forming cytoskeletal protein, partial [Ectothiorhodospiraceae bacterium]
CNTLEIVHGGRVQGEVSTAELIIEPGGRFIGESVRREEEVTAIIPETPVPAPHDTPEVGEIRGAEAEPQSRDDPLQGSVG